MLEEKILIMDNIVTIVNQKPSEIEFELGIDGITPKDIDVRFMLEAKDHCLVFHAKREKGDMWVVKIPALPHLEKTAFPFKIEAVVDGYHLNVAKGTANVTGSIDVYVKKADKVKAKDKEEEKKPEPKKEEAKKPEVKKEEKVEAKESKAPDSLQKAREVAEKILGEKKETGTAPVVKKPLDKSDRDYKIKKILSETTTKKEEKKTPVRKAEPKTPVKKVIEEKVEKPVEKKPEPIKISEKELKLKKLLEDTKEKAPEKPKATSSFVKGKVIEG